ncbi:unnamed protein product [Calypogeia fissa]
MPLATSSVQQDLTAGLEQEQFRITDPNRLYSNSRDPSRAERTRRPTYSRISSLFSNGILNHRPEAASGPNEAPGSFNCRLCANSDQLSKSSPTCSEHENIERSFNPQIAFPQDIVHKCRPGWSKESGEWIFGKVVDPRSKIVQLWNRLFLLVCVVGAALDPLFLYLLSLHMELVCLFVNKNFAVTVTIIRVFIDGLYVCHMWLQLKLAYVSKDSLVLGTGQLVWDAKKIAKNYLRKSQALIFDVFVILPIPQFVFWVIVPYMIANGARVSTLLGVIIFLFCLQYVPKILHMVLVIRRMQHVTGYIFGTAWWGFALNLIAYFIAAHIAGAVWYLLTINEIEECVLDRCWTMENCTEWYFGCPVAMSYGDEPLLKDLRRASFAMDPYLQNECLRNGGSYNFGIYRYAVPLATQSQWAGKVLYPLFWGLMTLSSFGNALQPSNEPLEVAFSIFVITWGLILFMLLIGNIQVFLHSITSRKEMMQLRIRDIEWWMKRRQLPPHLRQRVRGYERQRWAATRGLDESSMVCDLPESLRREIKRHLCLDLVLQVPLFEKMDELVLDNICERLTARLFIKGETILKEGDPVMRMLFLVRGHFQSSYKLNNNTSSYCQLGPGNFCGDELLSWCLRKTPVDRLPPSTITLTSLDSAEVFALEARDLKFVVQHFRHKFEDEKMKRTLRFYSTSWRMWAAVTIQLAWRRLKSRRNHTSISSSLSPTSAVGYAFQVPQAYLSMSDTEAAMRTRRLRMYTAMFTSPKPSTHLE